MIVTALLVRWIDGWHDVTDAAAVGRWGRKEAMLGLGAVEALSEVETVSREQLRIFGDPLTEISCDTFPVGEPDTPYVAYQTGDMVTVPNRVGLPAVAERVQSITVTMDDNGRVTYATELRDVLMDERERFSETLTKLANGSLGGYSKVAQPTSYTPSKQKLSTLSSETPTGMGMRVVTNRPVTDAESDILRTVPGGDGDYTLTEFKATPLSVGFDNGGSGNRYIGLWQDHPGSGADSPAEIDLGQDHQVGVVYYGTITNPVITFGPEWGIWFGASWGGAPGDIYVEAVFSEPGGTITVGWNMTSNALSVRPGP